MRENLLTRGIAIVLACTMAFTCACGSLQKETTSANDTENENYVYEFNDMGLPFPENGSISCIQSTSYGMCGLKNSISDGHNSYSIVKIKDGSDNMEEILLGFGDVDYDWLISGDDGCFYVIRIDYSEKKSKQLVKYSAYGDEIWNHALSKEDENSHIESVAYLKGRGIITCSQAGFTFYYKDSGDSKNVEMDSAAGSDRRFYTMKDGTVYLCVSDKKQNYYIYKFDSRKYSFGEAISIPKAVIASYKLFAGKDYDFYYIRDDRIESFNIGDSETETICDFAKSSFVPEYIEFISDEGSKNLVLIVNDYDKKTRAYSMSLQTEKNDKQVITVGTAFTSDFIKEQVALFNRESDEYTLRIVDYSEENFTNYYGVYSKMNDEILGGNTPDIYVMNTYVSYDKYYNKGLFEPLDEFIENDDEISGNKYLQNIMNMGKRDGRQYMLIPYFGVATCAASSNIMGDETVSLGNYRNMCIKHNVKIPMLMGPMVRDAADDLYSVSGFSFINFEESTCNFKNVDFVNLIGFIDSLPKWDDQIDMSSYNTTYRNRKSLILPYYMTSFSDYNVIREGYFGGDITFNGYPVQGGGKSYVDPGLIIAMSSSCKNKEGAWEFIREFMLENYQTNKVSAFPVLESAYNRLLENSQEESYYIDSKGMKIDTGSKFVLDDKEIIINPLSKKQADQVDKFIRSLTDLKRQDAEIVIIIKEVVNSYYNDAIIPEKAATVIQHRVEKYLAE